MNGCFFNVLARRFAEKQVVTLIKAARILIPILFKIQGFETEKREKFAGDFSTLLVLNFYRLLMLLINGFAEGL